MNRIQVGLMADPASPTEIARLLRDLEPLDQAPEGYKNFDSRKDGWTKVVLHPASA